jgi:hypothetical protein
MDDLLLSGLTEKEVTDTTISPLKFLGHGLRVSKLKLQFVEEEVKYLGHLISKGKRRLGPEIIEGITGIPLPETKRELQQFLGLIEYCRLWIESCALRTKILYSKLVEEKPDPLCWEPEEVQIIESLKQSLITAPVLALPSLGLSIYLLI